MPPKPGKGKGVSAAFNKSAAAVDQVDRTLCLADTKDPTASNAFMGDAGIGTHGNGMSTGSGLSSGTRGAGCG